MKQIIYCDIDGVMADFIWSFVAEVNNECGTKYTYYDITSSYLPDCLTDLSAEQQEVLFNNWCANGGFRRLQPIYGAVEVLNLLADRYNIHIVTARPLSAEGDTKAWLAEHKIPYKALHISESPEGKSAYVRKDSIVIEDNAITVADIISKHGAGGSPGAMPRVILSDHPWNSQPNGRLKECRGWIRISNWWEVLEYIITNFPS